MAKRCASPVPSDEEDSVADRSKQRQRTEEIILGTKLEEVADEDKEERVQVGVPAEVPAAEASVPERIDAAAAAGSDTSEPAQSTADPKAKKAAQRKEVGLVTLQFVMQFDYNGDSPAEGHGTMKIAMPLRGGIDDIMEHVAARLISSLETFDASKYKGDEDEDEDEDEDKDKGKDKISTKEFPGILEGVFRVMQYALRNPTFHWVLAGGIPSPGSKEKVPVEVSSCNPNIELSKSMLGRSVPETQAREWAEEEWKVSFKERKVTELFEKNKSSNLMALLKFACTQSGSILGEPDCVERVRKLGFDAPCADVTFVFAYID